MTATTPEMNIYVCIIPEKHFSRVGVAPLATTAADSTGCGAPTTSSAVAFSGRENSEKTPTFFATPTPTPPCAHMYIIHFPRAVIHQHRLLRMPRATNKKFPPAPKRSPEFLRIPQLLRSGCA
jgi:hypothetical protein